ncbi:hypothetical protein ABES03_02700 [Neobacillus rhizosphaerae]|uniref:hypothetical protein n=1 Tax=Neobacillus rhizosphaerae TaxID=2880965 RepID=UPI003D2A89EE
MVIIFLLLLVLSILSLLSLWSLKKRFDPFEAFILFMFSSYWCQNFFYLLSSPYQRLRVVEMHLPFWSARLQYGIIFPVLLMWVLYVLRGNHRLSVKIVACFSWVAGGVFIEKLLLVVGVLVSKSKSWYPSIDFILAMIVLYTCIFFMEKLPPILRREMVLRDEGDL